MTKFRGFGIILNCVAIVMGSCHEDATPAINKGEDQPPPLIADFSFFPNICSTPSVIDFLNSSQNAESYKWDFGEGTSSSEVSPQKTYQNAGDYQVTLTAYTTNKSVTVTKTIAIPAKSGGVNPEAKFEVAIDLSSRLEVTFTNQSLNADSYFWNFGDGTPGYSTTSTKFVHIYPGPGQYNAMLIATNKNGGNCVTVTIRVN